MPPPYVQVATFCERVAHNDGNMSIVSCISNVRATPPRGAVRPPGAVLAVSIAPLTLAVSLWGDGIGGDYVVSVRPKSPSRQELPPDVNPVVFNPETAGIDLTLQYPIPLTETGLYWFDVFVSGPDGEERLVTRVPLMITPVDA